MYTLLTENQWKKLNSL